MFLQEQLSNLRKLIDDIKSETAPKAQKATEDSEGNVIADTYIKKTDDTVMKVVRYDEAEKALYIE